MRLKQSLQLLPSLNYGASIIQSGPSKEQKLLDSEIIPYEVKEKLKRMVESGFLSFLV
jgi:hypothetical protein